MKIIASKANLTNVLRRANCAVSSRPMLPILCNVLLCAKDDRLTVSATDNEIAIVTSIPALVEEEGQTTLPAKKLQQIISALPDGDVSIESGVDDTSTITCQKSLYKIHGLDAAGFPKADSMQSDWSFEMKTQDLTRGLAKVFYARSTDETRKQLNGTVLSLQDGLMTIAATDGRRMALFEVTLDAELDASRNGNYILPSKASSELAHCLDDSETVKISLNKSEVSFEGGDTCLTTKLVEGAYPNFRQVIPENCGCQVTVQRALFMSVLSRVALVLQDSSGAVRLTFTNGQMLVSATSNETGESSEPMEVAYEGDEVNISFNPTFFLDPLKVMEADNITIEFGRQFSPVKLTGDDGFLYMLMPMRG